MRLEEEFIYLNPIICQLPRMELSIWLELFRLNVETVGY